MARITVAAEEVKRHLSDHATAEGTIDGLEIEGGGSFSLPFRLTRAQLEQLISGYVDRTIDLCRAVMTTAGVAPAKVSQILCVGGSTRIPMVRQKLADLFGKPPQIKINPDEVVAQGAAIQAGSLVGDFAHPAATSKTLVGIPTPPLPSMAPALLPALDAPTLRGAAPVDLAMAPAPAPLRRPLLLDVTPATMGIATAGGYCEKLIEKNAPIPIERTKVFTTARDDQMKVMIDCCRGEARRYAENEPIGHLILDDLPPRKRGEVKIEVTFRVDTDGILHVRAKDAQTGVEQAVSLTILGAPT